MSQIARIKKRQIVMMGVRNLYYDIIVHDNDTDEEILKQFEENMEIYDPVEIDYEIEQVEDMETLIDYKRKGS